MLVSALQYDLFMLRVASGHCAARTGPQQWGTFVGCNGNPCCPIASGSFG